MGRKSTKMGDSITLANKPGPDRKYYCPVHDTLMTPIKIFGKKGTLLGCKEGCRMNKSFAIKK